MGNTIRLNTYNSKNDFGIYNHENRWNNIYKLTCYLSNYSNIENKLIIFVPYCDYFSNYIQECLESIDNQEYNNYEVIIVNDGGIKLEFINNYIKYKSYYKLINKETNLGPASSKYEFIKYIKENLGKYNINDIVITIDGDDYLVTNQCFKIINQTYYNHKCWMTYGEMFEIFANPFKESFNCREKSLIGNHPRTYKLFTLLHLSEEDFKFNNSFLESRTDRVLFYNISELCGEDKIYHITDILYKYRETNDNVWKKVSTNRKKQLDYFLKNKEPQKLFIEDIHIVMCCYKRYFNLEQQINNLNEQTISNRIHLHLVNNNIICKDNIINIINNLKNNKIKISLKHYDNSMGPFKAFAYIRDIIIKNFPIDYVIIIDDDQLFENYWVEKLWNMRTPKKFISWYCKKWIDNKNYWTGSVVTYNDCKSNIKSKYDKFDYGATCGCIIDVTIFNENSELWNFDKYDISNEIIFKIDDLYLSYIIKKFYNWDIIRSYLPEKISLNDVNIESSNQALFKTLKNEKTQLFNLLFN